MKLFTSLLLCTAFIGNATITFSQEFKFLETPTRFKGHRTSVNDVSYNPKGTNLATAGGKNQVIVFDANSGEQAWASEENFSGNAVNLVDYNKDGSLLAASGFGCKSIYFFDAKTGERKHQIDGINGAHDLHFSPTADLIIGAVNVGEGRSYVQVKVWKVDNGSLIHTLFKETDASNELSTTVAFSHDGNYMAAGFSNKNTGVKIWDVATGELVRNISYPVDITNIKYSADGKYLAGASKDNVAIWSTETGALVHTLKGMSGWLSALAFSPDSKLIAAGGMDRSHRFKLWDVSTGKEVQSIDERGADVNELEFHPNGQSMAMGLQTYGDAFDVATVLIWSTTTGVLTADWHKFSSSKAKLNIEFPAKPEYTTSRSGSYSKHMVKLTHSYYTYDIYGEQYHGNVTDAKRSSREQEMTNFYKKNKEVVWEKPFTYNGETGIDMLAMKGTIRHRYRIIYIGDMLYRVNFGSRNKDECAEEKRFMESFAVYGAGTTTPNNTVISTASKKWHNFQSKEAKYSILFPFKPSTKKQELDDGNINYITALTNDTEEYVVVATDRTKTTSAKKLAKATKALGDNFIGKIDATAASQKEYDFNGYKGIDYVLKKEGKKTCLYRIVPVGQIVYQIIYTSTLTNEARGKKFLDSVKFYK